MCSDNTVYEGTEAEAVVKPTVAQVFKIENGYVIKIGEKNFIAKSDYEVANIIKRGLGEVVI